MTILVGLLKVVHFRVMHVAREGVAHAIESEGMGTESSASPPHPLF